jgi:bla regulator protein BlaR1
MIALYLSRIWTAAAPIFADHLWQSTLFALAAGLLTLALKKNHARTHYWLWLAASLKFLLPFSLLIGLGGLLPAPNRSTPANQGLFFAMEQVGQPFTAAAATTVQSTPQATDWSQFAHLLPAVLMATWLCGFLTVLVLWCVRWRRVSASIRESSPLREGRETEALRRLESIAGPKPIPMLLSRTTLEPGVFGIFQPILIWPAGISERLDDAHLDAVLAHELWHVRRRDNLAAAIHMVVEAIFWFHPLVWWMGVRLMEARERACDQEVLDSGRQRQVYAESILKICEFCVSSPLACISGVTGADLKKRIGNVMNETFVRKLNLAKKLLLLTAGIAAFAIPVMFGAMRAKPSRTESHVLKITASSAYHPVSIQPAGPGDGVVHSRQISTLEGFSAKNVTLQQILSQAYEIDGNQITGAPDWIGTQYYDIEAKLDAGVANELRKLDKEQRGNEMARLLQGFVADHFKLTLHHETRNAEVFVLVIAGDAPKLHEAKPGDTYPNGIRGLDGQPGAGMLGFKDGKLIGQAVPIKALAGVLSHRTGRTVLDKTGLTGKYDLTLQWQSEKGLLPDYSESSKASLFTALQEQLGLKLEPQTAPLEYVVIDHVEKPTEH